MMDMCLLPNLQSQDLKDVSRNNKTSARKTIDLVISECEIALNA